MDLQKIGVKLYAPDGAQPPLQDFVPVFHRWIQRSTLAGTLIDVVDYRHVHHGPGVMLIGYDFHLAVDDDGGERGISVDWKRPLSGDSSARVGRVLSVALDAAIALEAATFPGGRVEFDGTRLEVRVSDRILAPNDDQAWASFRDEMGATIGRLMPASRLRLERTPDPRRRLAARISASPPFALRDLRDRLAANP